MEKYLYIAPALVAILVFINMRNRQAKRKDDLRERMQQREETLMEMLAEKQTGEEN